MDAVQIAFALVDLWETFARNVPQLDLKTKTLTLGHSESARRLAEMLESHPGAREQLAAACTADPSLAGRLEAVADAMPFAETLRAVIGVPAPAAPVAVESAPQTVAEPAAEPAAPEPDPET